MNWISENKFLSAFIGFMIVGVGALGFLLFEAISSYADVHDTYTKAVQKLDSLQKLVPYPNDDNLKRYQAQEDELGGIVNTLEQNLAVVQFPLDPAVSPSKFQDNLRAAVADEVQKAQANKIVLPEKFALGFDQYLTSPPVAGAAPALDRELKAMQFIFDELLDGPGVTSISSNASGQGVNRAQLPEEKPGGKPSTALVVKNDVEISFVANQDKVRKVLNDLVQTKKQFYIVRLVHFRNQDDGKLLLKTDAFKTRNQASGAPRFVLGDEKLEVTLSLEIVNFNPPQK